MNPEPETEFLSPKQAADYMRVSLPTVYAMIRTRQIEAVRNGGRWLIGRRALVRQFPPRPAAQAGYVSVKEAATMMGKPAPTVYSHVQMGIFPALRIGGRWFLRLADIATHKGVWANSAILSTSNTPSANTPSQHTSHHLAAFVALIIAFFSLPTFSHAGNPTPSAGVVAPKIDAEGILLMRRDFADKLPDTELINHRGEKKRFFSDLVKGKAVIISFFYTNCEGICPATNVRLREMRDALRPIFGRSLNIMSISVDADRDTPAKIARYAQMIMSDSADPDMPDWQFLTGNADEILSLRQFMGYVEPDADRDAKPSSHSGMLIFGNQATGRWANAPSAGNFDQVLSLSKRIMGWTQDQRYADIYEEVLASRARQEQQVAPAAQTAPTVLHREPPVLTGRVGDLYGHERNKGDVNLASLIGKVVVMGQLYTPCPHGSHAVISAMTQLNAKLGSHGDFHQVCLTDRNATTTPEFFRSYAKALGITEAAPWWFLTSEHPDLAGFVHYSLGLKESKPIPQDERLNPLDLYDSDLRLVLIDKKGRVRGRYEVFNPDLATSKAATEQLCADAEHLLGQHASL